LPINVKIRYYQFLTQKHLIIKQYCNYDPVFKMGIEIHLKNNFHLQITQLRLVLFFYIQNNIGFLILLNDECYPMKIAMFVF